MLGIFGPRSLLAILGMLSAGVILCFGGLQWADFTHLGSGHPADFGDDLYFSAGAFFSASAPAHCSSAPPSAEAGPSSTSTCGNGRPGPQS
jgi:hypothetical protein